MLELVLTYMPQGCADRAGIAVARTEDPALIRAVAERVVRESEAEAAMWQRIDPNLARLRRADVDRLRAIVGEPIWQGSKG